MFAPDVGAAEVSALEGVRFGDGVDGALSSGGDSTGVGGATRSSANYEEAERTGGGGRRKRSRWNDGFFHDEFGEWKWK